jgi:DNA-directed RNA polymerase specialized sigma24 family protein
MTVEELFRRHATDVLAYALRRSSTAGADDVVSEVFLVAAKKLADVPEDEPLLWLYAVARRVIANQRRAARRREALHGALAALRRDPWHVPPDAGSPLLEAVAALKAGEREVLMLSAWEGLSAREAAVVLGCSEAAFHQRLSRARNRLSAQLARLPDTEPRPVEAS